eukprot:TRINITY_DN40958_c0_g1_i1.p1 TRINITY_DN40958_c0_g1~~TRINITY_DN40958_c0_g1_i1.p1  ORF type:complete len:401 (+),score=88.68 TRINITY_DN40958_c0_g1_i1:72-1274(+)
MFNVLPRDDSGTSSRLRLSGLLRDESYGGLPAVPGLDCNSQASLNKRLASVAGLDGTADAAAAESGAPTDFKFLFEQGADQSDGKADAALLAAADASGKLTTPPKHRRLRKRLESVPSDPSARKESAGKEDSGGAPEVIEDADYRWIRTDIQSGKDLVDGQAWIREFAARLQSARGEACGSSAVTSADAAAGAQRTASSSSSNGMGGLRNKVLKQMSKVCPQGPGRKVRLPSSDQEVIFWFNVGMPGPPRKRVYVTEARCPHQGVCLLGGELLEVEDLTGVTTAAVRCPRHNKTFQLGSGLSPGNSEVLRQFPCRFEHGHWYVGIEPIAPAESGSKETPQSTPRSASILDAKSFFAALEAASAAESPSAVDGCTVEKGKPATVKAATPAQKRVRIEYEKL